MLPQNDLHLTHPFPLLLFAESVNEFVVSNEDSTVSPLSFWLLDSWPSSEGVADAFFLQTLPKTSADEGRCEDIEHLEQQSALLAPLQCFAASSLSQDVSPWPFFRTIR